MSNVSVAETLSSLEWIEGIREQLAGLSGRDGTLERAIIERQLGLQVELARASIGLMGELPQIKRPVTRQVTAGLKVIRATQNHTRTYSLGYHPNHGHDLESSALIESESFARLIEYKYEAYKKRPFVPTILGGIALKEQTAASTHVGLEFNSHSPIEPHLFDLESDHVYRTVSVDIGDVSDEPILSGNKNSLSYDNISGLAEGLHAIAVSSQMSVSESGLSQPKVFVADSF